MLNEINLWEFQPKNSQIHTMHPLSKILCSIIFIIAIIITDDSRTISILTILLFLMIGFSNLKIKYYIKPIISFTAIIIIVLFINQIINNSLFVINMIKIMLIIESITLVVLTTTKIHITEGVKMLLTPFKIIIPANIIAHKICLTLCFISNIDKVHKNYKRIKKIKEIKFKIANPFIILNNAMNITELNAEVMEARGYNSSFCRTSIRTVYWKDFDSYFLFLHLLILVLIITKGGAL